MKIISGMGEFKSLSRQEQRIETIGFGSLVLTYQLWISE
jgi:hypothetical protein